MGQFNGQCHLVLYTTTHASSANTFRVNRSFSDTRCFIILPIMSKIITLQELKKNNTIKSMWIAIHDKVYDVTKFIDSVRIEGD